MMLADLGADVIKIEPPAGDSTPADAGRRRHRQPALQRRESRQAQPGAESQIERRPRRAHCAWRARPTSWSRTTGPGVMSALGLDYRRLGGDQSAADLRVDLGLRPDRARSQQGRLRSHRAGRVGHHVDHRRAGRPAGESWHPADRSRRRVVRAGRHSRRAGVPPSHRTRTARSTRRWWRPASRCRSGKRRNTSRGSGAPEPLGSAHRMNAPYQAIRCADGYITHRRGERAAVSTAVRGAGSPGVGRDGRVRRQREPRAPIATGSPP